MSVQSRFNRTGKIYSFTESETDVGGIARVENLILSNWRCYLYPPSPRTREMTINEFGLELDVQITIGTGDYSALIARDQLFVDDSDTTNERYFILAAHTQRRNVGNSHLAVVFVKDTGGA